MFSPAIVWTFVGILFALALSALAIVPRVRRRRADQRREAARLATSATVDLVGHGLFVFPKGSDPLDNGRTLDADTTHVRVSTFAHLRALRAFVIANATERWDGGACVNDAARFQRYDGTILEPGPAMLGGDTGHDIANLWMRVACPTLGKVRGCLDGWTPERDLYDVPPSYVPTSRADAIEANGARAKR